jgi:hypothetical protein
MLVQFRTIIIKYESSASLGLRIARWFFQATLRVPCVTMVLNDHDGLPADGQTAAPDPPSTAHPSRGRTGTTCVDPRHPALREADELTALAAALAAAAAAAAADLHLHSVGQIQYRKVQNGGKVTVS